MKILLEAPILTQSGYGEHSRVVYQSLKDKGYDIYINPLNWGNTSWTRSEDEEEIGKLIVNFHKYMKESKDQNKNPEFDMQIHVGILNEFQKKGKYSVCVTAGIETDRVSSAWLIKTHQGVDKIIVPSTHSRKTMTEVSYEVENKKTSEKTVLRCACPVDVVPYPVKEFASAPIEIDIDTDFNFLSVALLGPRKNLENSIKWFLEEFKEEPNVGLIVKTAISKSSLIDRRATIRHIKDILANHKNSKCKVYLLHGNMTPGEINSLYSNSKVKAFTTATHGEGYGLPVFEAAYNGIPVIATDWSAHLDFLSGPYKEAGKIKEKKLFARVDYKMGEIPKHVIWKDILIEGAQWAYPIEASYKTQLRKVYKNYGMYKKWAKALKDRILETHRAQAVYENMYQSLVPLEMRSETKRKEVTDEIENMFASLSEG
mgnify:CR=1 FL=1